MPARTLTQYLVTALVGFLLGAAVLWQAYGKGVRDREKTDAGRADRRLALLERENERLRALVERQARADKLAANKVHREAIEKQVEAIRGLTFKTPVDYNVLSRSEIKGVIEKKMDEVFTREEFRNISAALGRLGLLPENFPLRETYIDLLGEQIAAFYDQHQHKLFMFEDASLDNEQNRIVLAHELTHALQDQHFGLKKLPLEIKTNDDRAAAASALVEGDATLVMSEFMLKNLSLRSLKDNLASSLTQSTEQLQRAPMFLREVLIFPYLRGQEFCSALLGRGGYNAISGAYAQPPSSTSQILHPEKYLGDAREEPIAIEWSDLTVNGQAPTVDNVAGELGMRILLSELLKDGLAAEGAAEGWRGDRYLAFGNGEHLVWKTVWASPSEATEFFEAEKRRLERRYPGQTLGRSAQEERYSADGGRFLRIHRAEATVMSVDAGTAEWARMLEERFR